MREQTQARRHRGVGGHVSRHTLFSQISFYHNTIDFQSKMSAIQHLFDNLQLILSVLRTSFSKILLIAQPWFSMISCPNTFKPVPAALKLVIIKKFHPKTVFQDFCCSFTAVSEKYYQRFIKVYLQQMKCSQSITTFILQSLFFTSTSHSYMSLR